MSHYSYNLFLITRLAPIGSRVLLSVVLGCNALIFDLLCTLLCSLKIVPHLQQLATDQVVASLLLLLFKGIQRNCQHHTVTVVNIIQCCLSLETLMEKYFLMIMC